MNHVPLSKTSIIIYGAEIESSVGAYIPTYEGLGQGERNLYCNASHSKAVVVRVSRFWEQFVRLSATASCQLILQGGVRTKLKVSAAHLRERFQRC